MIRDRTAQLSTSERELPAAEWALAHVLVAWRREVSPQLRKVYKAACEGEVDREAVAEIASRVEGFARALRAAADPKLTKPAGPRIGDEA